MNRVVREVLLCVMLLTGSWMDRYLQLCEFFVADGRKDDREHNLTRMIFDSFLESAHLALVGHGIYYYMIIGRGNIQELLGMPVW